jgi:hypothetical protein
MSSDIDHPRQRTVAELLAEHGAGVPSGRRRRRRAADDADEPVDVPGPVATEVRAPAAERPAEPAPAVPAEANGVAVATPGWEVPQPDPFADREPVSGPLPNVRAPAPNYPFGESIFGSDSRPEVEEPTEQIPLIGKSTRDVGHTGPMERLRRANPRWRDALEAVERTEREMRSSAGVPAADDRFDDGGPPTAAAAPLDLFAESTQDTEARPAAAPDDQALPMSPTVGPRGGPAGRAGVDDWGMLAGPADPARREGRSRGDGQALVDDDAEPGELARYDEPPAGLDRPLDRPRKRGRRPGFGRPTPETTEPTGPAEGSAHPDGLDDLDQADLDLAHDDPADQEPRRRLGRTAAEAASGTAAAWAIVLAQWLGGAVGGAALWIAFRFLWRSLPVVALAAAVLLTVGLVLLVRALLRTDGPRTTVLAVLVGLLITVSPAILVLLDR